MIIMLSGTSSSGKSTLAHELKNTLSDHWLIFSTDDYLSMLGEKFLNLHPDNLSVCDPNAVCYAKKHIDGTFEIIPGELCSKLYLTIPNTLDLIAKSGFNIILDSFITTTMEFDSYKNQLSKHGLFSVYLYASEKEIERRETTRGDRLKGSAIHWLRKFDFQNQCDLLINTEKMTMNTCSETIIDKINIK